MEPNQIQTVENILELNSGTNADTSTIFNPSATGVPKSVAINSRNTLTAVSCKRYNSRQPLMDNIATTKETSMLPTNVKSRFK